MAPSLVLVATPTDGMRGVGGGVSTSIQSTLIQWKQNVSIFHPKTAAGDRNSMPRTPRYRFLASVHSPALRICSCFDPSETLCSVQKTAVVCASALVPRFITSHMLTLRLTQHLDSSPYTCVYIYIYIYMNYIYIYINVFMYLCLYTYVHTYLYMDVCVHTHVYIYAFVYVYICICIPNKQTNNRTYTHIYTHVPTYIHTYIHTYTHTDIHTDIQTYILALYLRKRRMSGLRPGHTRSMVPLPALPCNPPLGGQDLHACLGSDLKSSSLKPRCSAI